VRSGIEKYLRHTLKNIIDGQIPEFIDRVNTGEAKFKFIHITDSYGLAVNDFFLNDPIRIVLGIEVYDKIIDSLVDVQISTMDGVVITHSMNVLDDAGYFSFDKGKHEVSIELENNFQPGNYAVSIGIHKSSYGTPTIEYIESISKFNVTKLTRDENSSDYNLDFVYGYIRPKTKWKIEKKFF